MMKIALILLSIANVLLLTKVILLRIEIHKLKNQRKSVAVGNSFSARAREMTKRDIKQGKFK